MNLLRAIIDWWHGRNLTPNQRSMRRARIMLDRIRRIQFLRVEINR